MAANKQDRHVPGQLTASLNLLEKFTGQWEQLHRTSESNINKSKTAIGKLLILDQCCKKRLLATNDFATSYKTLSVLGDHIDNIECDLNSLEKSFIELEECLSKLARLNEQTNCEKFIRECKGNFEAQAQLLKIQTEISRDRLMAEHLKRVQLVEHEQQSRMNDRRAILKNEFEAEKRRYLENNTSNLKDE